MRKPTSRRDRVIWCNRGWYPVYYGFCPSESAWNRELKRLSVKRESYPTVDARTTHLENAKGDLCCIVTMRSTKRGEVNAIQRAALFAHEAVHVWQAIRENIDEQSPSHEMEAYAVQAIAQELMLAYEKTRGKLWA